MKGKIEMEIPLVRPTVHWYAFRMEKRLKEKDTTNKKGWNDGNFYCYTAKIFKCLKKILDIIPIVVIGDAVIHKENSVMKEKEIHLAIKKCIDGGNFFMMLADNLRDELIRRGIK